MEDISIQDWENISKKIASNIKVGDTVTFYNRTILGHDERFEIEGIITSFANFYSVIIETIEGGKFWVPVILIKNK